MKTCNNIVMLYSVRNVTEVLLDRLQVRHVLLSYLYNCNSLFTCFLSHQVFYYLYNCISLFTCFLSHQVFIFTHMISLHFSAFFMHNSRCNTLAVRTVNCRLLQRHFRDVALTPARIMDITLQRMTCAGNHLLSWNRHSLATKRSKWSEILGPYIPYGLFQTKGKMCAKCGSDRFRNVDLYKVQTKTHTHIQTNKQNKTKNFQLYIQGVPGGMCQTSGAYSLC